MSKRSIAMVGTPVKLWQHLNCNIILTALLMLNWAYSVWRIFHTSTS